MNIDMHAIVLMQFGNIDLSLFRSKLRMFVFFFFFSVLFSSSIL